MSGEKLIGMIITAICCFGSGAIFLGIGIRARKAAQPVNFWAGREVDPTSVSDISAYNRECSKIWTIYAVPYFLSGLLGLLDPLHEWFMITSLIILLAAAFPGIWLLIHEYRKIEKKYIDPKRLDKIDPIC